MVTVISYNQRQSEEGKEFYTLTIQGGIEVVQSQNGNLYMTARKMSIPSTFDEQGCEMVLGQDLPGEIVKVDCEPYEYTNKNTGDIITLTHSYEYVAEEKQENNKVGIPEFIPFNQQQFDVGQDL
ncbi:MAG: hypothetical protein ACI93N_001033 [Flavobacteriaceae bacterium]|jgi:hypothetical protein